MNGPSEDDYVPSRRRLFGVIAAILAALILLAPAAAQRSSAGEPKPLVGLSIVFRLDPLAVGATFGERWLAGPPFTSTLQPGEIGTVTVRVRGRGPAGELISVFPEWTIADQDLVSVTSHGGDTYTIIAHRAGETDLSVAAQGITITLSVRAAQIENAMRVYISRRNGPAEPYTETADR